MRVHTRSRIRRTQREAAASPVSLATASFSGSYRSRRSNPPISLPIHAPSRLVPPMMKPPMARTMGKIVLPPIDIRTAVIATAAPAAIARPEIRNPPATTLTPNKQLAVNAMARLELRNQGLCAPLNHAVHMATSIACAVRNASAPIAQPIHQVVRLPFIRCTPVA